MTNNHTAQTSTVKARVLASEDSTLDDIAEALDTGSLVHLIASRAIAIEQSRQGGLSLQAARHDQL